MEALSIMLEIKMYEGQIIPLITRNAPEASHFLFADDLLIFWEESI